MQSIKSFTRVMAGLALSTTLFLGCQDFLGQKSETTTTPNTENLTPQEVALKLKIKDSAACLEMKDKIIAAHEKGTDIRTTDSTFVANCVQEVPRTDGDKPNLPVPPILTPDDKTRCHWILTQIDGGREEMVLKFRFYCPDDCKSMETADTLGHEKYCRDPKPDCSELTRKLSLMDAATEDFARLHHLIGEVCVEHPKVDSIPPQPKPPLPDMSICDSLKIELSKSTPGTELHKAQEVTFREHCPAPEPIKPVPMPDFCVDLKIKLGASAPGTPEHIELEHMFKEKCMEPVPPVVVPPKVNCDEIRAKLAGMEPGSADYTALKTRLAESCPVIEPKPPVVVVPVVNCDELRAKLAGIDSTTDGYAALKHQFLESCPAPKPPVVVIPVVNCDEIRAKLATLDSTSADYLALKHKLAENCPVPKPPVVEPKPIIVVNCDELRMKLSLLDPASADYARIKGTIAERCPEAPVVQ